MFQRVVIDTLTYLFMSLLDQEAKDAMFDAAEAHIARKNREEGRKFKRELAAGALSTLRKVTNTPDEPEEIDQEKPL